MAPSWGPVTKPAYEKLTSRSLKGTVEQTPTCSGPKPLMSLQDVRSPHHYGLDVPSLLLRDTGTLPLDWDPGMPPVPERALLLVRPPRQ